MKTYKCEMCEKEFKDKDEEELYAIDTAVICEGCFKKIKAMLTKPKVKDKLH